MANTAASDISTSRICLNPSEAIIVTGILAGDYLPGEVVVSIANVWTTAINTTAAHKLMHWGVVGYQKRIRQSTGAEIDIDTAWDTSETEDKQVPIITDGFVIARFVDQNAAANLGTGLMVSTTTGALTLQDNAQIDHGSLAADTIDDDVFCIAGIGTFNGKIFGGQN